MNVNDRDLQICKKHNVWGLMRNQSDANVREFIKALLHSSYLTEVAHPITKYYKGNKGFKNENSYYYTLSLNLNFYTFVSEDIANPNKKFNIV